MSTTEEGSPKRVFTASAEMPLERRPSACATAKSVTALAPASLSLPTASITDERRKQRMIEESNA